MNARSGGCVRAVPSLHRQSYSLLFQVRQIPPVHLAALRNHHFVNLFVHGLLNSRPWFPFDFPPSKRRGRVHVRLINTLTHLLILQSGFPTISQRTTVLTYVATRARLLFSGSTLQPVIVFYALPRDSLTRFRALKLAQDRFAEVAERRQMREQDFETHTRSLVTFAETGLHLPSTAVLRYVNIAPKFKHYQSLFSDLWLTLRNPGN